MTKVTSVRLSDELVERLDKLAEAMERPRSWLIEQAVQQYVEVEMWQVEQIREALADYQAGTAVLIPHEQVMKEMHDLIRESLGDADRLA